MTMLPPGGYNFSEKKGNHKKKSMIFVKLTDSAQRALNDFIQDKDKNKGTPAIEFKENEGFIYIPACGKSPFVSQKSTRQFKFNVDSNVAMQGQKGLFECIQQKCGSKKLYKCGPLTKKLRIHANEDVYETTKNRMEAIKLEQRKNCTLEIDLNLATVNRKVKVDRNTKLNSSGVIENSDKTIKNQIEKVPKPGARNQPQSRNPNLMKRPLRERIIHMLAVKPHRKIELSVSLRKDGLRESDKTHLISTLSSVATLKGNMYHLLRHVWNDIQEDWPFYNELEKQQMKRNKPQNLTPPTSDSGISVGSNQSPSNIGDKSPSCHYKRPGYFNGVDGFQTKRHRISHYNKPGDPSSSLDMTNYRKKYVTISDLAQRRQYKADFKIMFDEYQEKSIVIHRVTDLFHKLSASLKQHEKGSFEFQKVEAEIVHQYNKLKTDKKYQETKQRFDCLHDTLSHIKYLVQEFDDKLNNSNSLT